MTEAGSHHESFTIERIYPSRRDRVWAAWAIPEKKRVWFGDGLTDSDFREGGGETKEFVNDMGTNTNRTHYFEIEEQAQIVFAYSMALNGRVHTVSLTTVEFSDVDEGTHLRYTEQMCVIPPSDGAKGRTHGWGALLDGLGRALADGVSP